MENEKIPSSTGARSQNLFILFLIILVGLLAGSTTYFFSQSSSLKLKDNTAKPSAFKNKNKPTNSSESESNNTSATQTQTATILNSDKLSQPSKIHQVEQGETLFPVGLKYNVQWTLIAQANGLAEPYVIKAGENLIIPDYDDSQKIPHITYTYDQDKAKNIQSQEDSGKSSGRTDPLSVAKLETSPAFGLKNSDNFVLKSKDVLKGEAVVTATSTDKNYQIKLIQPETKGEKGIWVISEVRPSK